MSADLPESVQPLRGDEVAPLEARGYHRPELLVDAKTHYCPDRGHGMVHRLLMEVIKQLGIAQHVIGVESVGCSVPIYNYYCIDVQSVAPGRAVAVATGVKQALPDEYVFTCQGDGDLAAIGAGQTLHAANRDQNILIVFLDNAIYGMPGGQRARPRFQGQVSSTTPSERDRAPTGALLKVSELIAQRPGVFYVTSQSAHPSSTSEKQKGALANVFKYQKLNQRVCLVQIVTTCSANWKMSPKNCNE